MEDKACVVGRMYGDQVQATVWQNAVFVVLGFGGMREVRREIACFGQIEGDSCGRVWLDGVGPDFFADAVVAVEVIKRYFTNIATVTHFSCGWKFWGALPNTVLVTDFYVSV
jgi:hypothetical protein